MNKAQSRKSPQSLVSIGLEDFALQRETNSKT